MDPSTNPTPVPNPFDPVTPSVPPQPIVASSQLPLQPAAPVVSMPPLMGTTPDNSMPVTNIAPDQNAYPAALPAQPIAAQLGQTMAPSQATVAQPTQPYGQAAPGVTQPILPTQPPSQAAYSNDYYASGSKPGLTLGILSIIFGLLLGIVGIVLGIIAALKGFRRGNKLLGILGVVGIMAGIASIIFAAIVVIPRIGGVKYSELKDITGTTINDETFQLSVPVEFENDASSASIISARHKNKDGQKLSEIVAVSSAQYFTPQEVEQFRTELTQKGAFYDAFVNQIKASASSKMENFEIGTFHEYSALGVPNAYSADFHYQGSTGKAGGTIRIDGRLVLAISPKNLYIVIASSTQDVWDANQKTWNKVLASFHYQ